MPRKNAKRSKRCKPGPPTAQPIPVIDLTESGTDDITFPDAPPPLTRQRAVDSPAPSLQDKMGSMEEKINHIADKINFILYNQLRGGLYNSKGFDPELRRTYEEVANYGNPVD